MRSSRFTRCVRRPFRPLLERLEERAVPSFLAARAFDARGGASSMAPGDVNGDGVLDLAVANSGGVSVLLGTGDGAFGAARNFAAGDLPWSVALGDVNGDGALDLAVANLGSGVVSVLLGTGDGAFGAARNFLVGDTSAFVALADVKAIRANLAGDSELHAFADLGHESYVRRRPREWKARVSAFLAR